ncbi:hypothetical protein [Actinophytocola sp.]|uniref:hypothetical protein n=1 Tax=Actinophytocola sp. TaxID=1872138 RepID=UPI003D6ADDA1
MAAAAVVFFVVDGGEEGEPAPAGQTPPGRPTGDPGEPAEPDAELARQTLDYLAGEGAPALTMHRAAAGLGDRPAADRCRQVGATLDRDAPPDQLVLVIEGVPDEVLRDLLGDERASLGVTLTACVKGEQPTYERVAPLPDAVTLVQRRLDSLEAIR